MEDKLDFSNIKTYEDACEDQKKDPNTRPDYSKCELSTAEEDFNLAVFELSRVLVSVNKEDGQEWKPKPTDRRYYPWAWINGSGSGRSLDDVGDDNSCTDVASRLTCRDEPRARYVFDQFRPLFERILIFHH